MFLFVIFLLLNKHVLVELLLKFFIRVVYAKLLKSIFRKDFKTKDVQQSYKIAVCLANLVCVAHRNSGVNFFNYPAKKVAI